MISVVIPLYNKEKSIATTLESVLAQSYTDYEIIVVDDGSTDNSANVVRELENGKWKRVNDKIRLISQPNLGVSSARNTGIMAAQGKFIAFLDADDLWAPNFLDTLAALMTDYPNAGLYSLGYEEIHSDTIPDKTLSDELHLRGPVEQPWTMRKGVWTGSVAASKERLIKLGLFDICMTHGEDIDMWWRLILDGGLVTDTKCCAYYRLDTENRAMNNVIPLEKHIPYYIDKYAHARETNKEFRRFFDEQMIYRLYPYLFEKEYRKEAKRLAKMIDYSQLKGTMRFRMQFPYIYQLYINLKSLHG